MLRQMPSNAKLPNQLRFKHDAVKAHDEKLYGDWKSADIIFADANQRPNLVGRWDWHAWQLLLACIPAGMIYALAQYARYDMEKNPIVSKQQKEQQKQQQAMSAAATRTASPEEERNKAALEERLATVESTLKTIVASLEKKLLSPSGDAIDTTPTKAAQSPAKPTALP